MDSVATSLTDSLAWLGPSLILVLGGCLILCGSLVTSTQLPRDVTERKNGYAVFTLALIAIAFIWHLLRKDGGDTPHLFGLFTWDATAMASERLALIGGLLLALIGWSSAPKAYLAEFFGCLTVILGAVCLVGACNDLMAMFLALELISIPTYVLLGTVKSANEGLESSIKYFLLSAFASGFFLLGGSYLYGVAGTTDLTVIGAAVNAGETNMLGLVGMVFLLCGLTFRITAVPFHFYGPDVFEGTSISIAAMMSYIPKVAGFVALVRFMGLVEPDSFVGLKLVPLVMVLAVVTFTVGNALAASQDNLRRMLGYSSVAHSGYLLLGLAAYMLGGPDQGVIFIYLLVYAAMTLGVFAFLAEVEEAGGSSHLISDMSGMFYRRPAASIAAVVCLISLIGFPPTAGLWAKFQIMSAAVAVDRTDFLICVLLMAVNAVIAAGYYWRVLAKIFDRSANLPPMRVWRPSLFLAYSICAVLTLVWFFVPSGI